MNKKVLDFDVLLKNVQAFKGKKVCAMVKDNAYGHGLCEIVGALKGRVEFFGVCLFSEALDVRKICDTKILIVSPFVDIEKCKKYGFHFFVQDLNMLKKAITLDCLDLVHIKLNVGMNRYGFDIENKKLLKELRLMLKNRHIAGICTHFPCLDNKKTTKKQYKKFLRVKNFLGIDTLVHLGGSGVFGYDFDFDMIRVGIGLYIGKGGQVMKIFSEIMDIKEVEKGKLGYDGLFEIKKHTKVAVIPIGYADGLLRYSSGGFVEINKKYCKIIGNICMDICFVDITDIDCKIGDRVDVLPNVFKLARHNQESIYEILTNFNNLREK